MTRPIQRAFYAPTPLAGFTNQVAGAAGKAAHDVIASASALWAQHAVEARRSSYNDVIHAHRKVEAQAIDSALARAFRALDGALTTHKLAHVDVIALRSVFRDLEIFTAQWNVAYARFLKSPGSLEHDHDSQLLAAARAGIWPEVAGDSDALMRSLSDRLEALDRIHDPSPLKTVGESPVRSVTLVWPEAASRVHEANALASIGAKRTVSGPVSDDPSSIVIEQLDGALVARFPQDSDAWVDAVLALQKEPKSPSLRAGERAQRERLLGAIHLALIGEKPFPEPARNHTYIKARGRKADAAASERLSAIAEAFALTLDAHRPRKGLLAWYRADFAFSQLDAQKIQKADLVSALREEKLEIEGDLDALFKIVAHIDQAAAEIITLYEKLTGGETLSPNDVTFLSASSRSLASAISAGGANETHAFETPAAIAAICSTKADPVVREAAFALPPMIALLERAGLAREALCDRIQQSSDRGVEVERHVRQIFVSSALSKYGG